MRIIANESHIKPRTKIGEYAPLVGLVILAGATALIFLKPEFLLLTMIMVWVGFLASLTGSYLGVRFVGPMAHHVKVPEALKGLDDNYALLMYMTPAPFVLLEPGGLTVITVRSQGGEVTYRDGKWVHRERLGFLRRIAGLEGVGRPDRAARLEMEDLRRFLTKRLPEDADTPIRTVILFTNSDVQLKAKDAPIPAFRFSQLKRWLRKGGRRSNLPEETQSQLAEALGIVGED